MPLLAFGEYTANIPSTDPEMVDPSAVVFRHYPWTSFVRLTGLVLLGIVLVLYFKRSSPRYSKSRHWVLVPGLIGFSPYLGLIFAATRSFVPFILFFLIPLQVTSVVILMWFLFRIRGIVPAVIASVVAASILLMFVAVSTPVLMNSGVFGVVIFLAGIALSLSLGVLRFAVRQGVSWKRLAIGFALGLGIGVLPVSIATGILMIVWQQQPTWILFALIPYFAIPSMFAMVPFFLLTGFIPWVQDVVTGKMFEPVVEDDVLKDTR